MRAALASLVLGFVFLLLTHLPYLRLPYHWDELGYFVPAAHDLFAHGRLVPRSTLPNVHPPLLMLYLAGVWKLFGFAIPVTRVAMLLVGAATMAAAWLLARQLANARAAWTTAALVAVSPPFVVQSMMAHLDLLATFWALVAICFFLERRWWACSAAATALALTKETGLLVPLVLIAFSAREKRRLALLLPFAAVACWLLYLRSVTGHWLGNPEFAEYNVAEPLRLGRIVLVSLRRLYQLGFANFHWVGAGVLVVAVRRQGALRNREWRLVAAVVAVYLAFHSILGGAVLLRYLLPAMALFYVATAVALNALRPRLRQASLALLLAGLAICNWWNPPYRFFSYEDNLAVTDFIRLQLQAARWLAEHFPDRTVTTAWPLSDALSNPLLGYVTRPLRVHPIDNFQPAAWDHVDPGTLEVTAFYSRSWERPGGWQDWPPVARLLQKYFGYRRQISRGELIERFRLRPVARWESRGHWMEILVR